MKVFSPHLPYSRSPTIQVRNLSCGMKNQGTATILNQQETRNLYHRTQIIRVSLPSIFPSLAPTQERRITPMLHPLQTTKLCNSEGLLPNSEDGRVLRLTRYFLSMLQILRLLSLKNGSFS